METEPFTVKKGREKMLKKHSIFKKLVFNILPISMIPFLIVLVFTCLFMCSGLKNEQTSSLRDKADSYIQSIDVSKSNAILKSDYIINNSETNIWFDDTSDMLYDQLIHIGKITSYTQIINASTDDTIMIYTDNPSIIPSRFTNRISSLENADIIRKRLKEADYMYFDDEIKYDLLQKPYLTLYRQVMSSREIILEIKAYIPEHKEFRLVKTAQKYLDGNKYISKAVTEKYLAVTPINTDGLAKGYIRYTLLFTLIGLFFCAIIIYASISITSRTTNTINGYILKLSGQSSQQRMIEKDSPDDSWELTVIKNTINELITSIGEKSEAQFKTELEKKRLELNLLQSKIDPHILYNSLAAISHKAFKSKDSELSNLVKDLTDYYRLVLARGRDFATVEEEIKLIEKFVAVCETSNSQKYTFISDISPEVKDSRIIHLLLQPFAENCIVHGLAGKKQECVIKVSCYSDDGKMIFKIYDNGYGIKKDKLSELKNLDHIDKNYGIKNTYDRMKIFYGDGCKINFESTPGEYTLVTITIPM